MVFVDEVLKSIYGLCVILYNVSVWMVEKLGVLLVDVLVCMM